MKIAIIGGGACGLICASKLASREDVSIEIIEINNRVGKKILQTGNGRCNFTNAKIAASDYNNPNFINPIIDEVDIADYFRQLGLYFYYDEQNRAYPLSENASTVLDVLRNSYLNKKNVIEKISLKVEQILKIENKYQLTFDNHDAKLYDKVILCIGSQIGNSTYNNQFMKSFKLKQKVIKPSLCPLKADVKGLNGIKVNADIKLFNNDKQIYSESGCEVLFKEQGLSGIGILNASAYLNRQTALKKPQISLNLLPHLKFEELLKDLLSRQKLHSADEASNLFIGICNKMIGFLILQKCDIKNTTLIKDLSFEQLNVIAKIFFNLSFNILGFYPLVNSQVAHGGINLEEVSTSFELKKYPGIYIGGEMLDIDGKCGGYNLHFAFLSGLIIAKKILESNK